MSIVARGFALGNTPGAIVAEGLGALNLGIVTVIRAGKDPDLIVGDPGNILEVFRRPTTPGIAARATSIEVGVRRRVLIIPPDTTD